jgi:putative transposase
MVLAALSRVLPRRSWQTFLVTPETLLRWQRRIIARRWTYPHRRPGRPPVDAEVRQLILRLARENGHWGYVRIVGELRKLGINVSATLVRNVLARAGIRPAPERAGSSWRSFLRHTDTRSSPVTCSPSTPSRSGRVGSNTSPVRASRTRRG